MVFYDATVLVIHRLVRCRLHRDAVDRVTCEIYVAAWLRAGEHADSGLSPLAWLATLVPSTHDPFPDSDVSAA